MCCYDIVLLTSTGKATKTHTFERTQVKPEGEIRLNIVSEKHKIYKRGKA